MFWKTVKETEQKLKLGSTKVPLSSFVFSAWKVGISVSSGKWNLSSLFPDTWLWFVESLPPSWEEHEQWRAAEHCVFSLFPLHVPLQVCVCVRAWGGTCFGTAEWEWLWPNPSPFCPHEAERAPPVTLWPCTGCRVTARPPACLHVFVCRWECTFHTCDRCGGSRGSKLLCEA